MEGKSGELLTVQYSLLTPEIVGRFYAVMPASRAARHSDRVAAGKTTWYGEGLQAIALAIVYG